MPARRAVLPRGPACAPRFCFPSAAPEQSWGSPRGMRTRKPIRITTSQSNRQKTCQRQLTVQTLETERKRPTDPSARISRVCSESLAGPPRVLRSRGWRTPGRQEGAPGGGGRVGRQVSGSQRAHSHCPPPTFPRRKCARSIEPPLVPNTRDDASCFPAGVRVGEGS